jgi:hypothetical protein
MSPLSGAALALQTLQQKGYPLCLSPESDQNTPRPGKQGSGAAASRIKIEVGISGRGEQPICPPHIERALLLIDHKNIAHTRPFCARKSLLFAG